MSHAKYHGRAGAASYEDHRYFVVALTGFSVSLLLSANDPEYIIYFGTYTAKISKGIHAYRYHRASGKLTRSG
jgi:hypothetical protein